MDRLSSILYPLSSIFKCSGLLDSTLEPVLWPGAARRRLVPRPPIAAAAPRRRGGLPYSASAAPQYRAVRRTVAQADQLRHSGGPNTVPCRPSRALAHLRRRAATRVLSALHRAGRLARWPDRPAHVWHAGIF